MTRLGEFIAFTGIAAAVHVGLLAQFGPPGAQSQGAAGQASVSLMASSGALSDMVATWTRPVEVMETLSQPPALAPTQSPPLPALSQPPSDDTPAALPKLPELTAALPEALPRIDTQTAQPPDPRAAPQASARPKERVAQLPKPAAKPAQSKNTSAAAKPQKARDGQSGSNAGSTRATQSASLSEAARRNLMAAWGASIRNRVERRKRYPAGTSASGTTVLRITLSRAGQLKGVSVVTSSGTRSLDKAAIRAVQSASYSAAPKGLDAGQYSFNLPVAFKR